LPDIIFRYERRSLIHATIRAQMKDDILSLRLLFFDVFLLPFSLFPLPMLLMPLLRYADAIFTLLSLFDV